MANAFAERALKVRKELLQRKASDLKLRTTKHLDNTNDFLKDLDSYYDKEWVGQDYQFKNPDILIAESDAEKAKELCEQETPEIEAIPKGNLPLTVVELERAEEILSKREQEIDTSIATMLQVEGVKQGAGDTIGRVLGQNHAYLKSLQENQKEFSLPREKVIKESKNYLKKINNYLGSFEWENAGENKGGAKRLKGNVDLYNKIETQRNALKEKISVLESSKDQNIPSTMQTDLANISLEISDTLSESLEQGSQEQKKGLQAACKAFLKSLFNSTPQELKQHADAFTTKIARAKVEKPPRSNSPGFH